MFVVLATLSERFFLLFTFEFLLLNDGDDADDLPPFS